MVFCTLKDSNGGAIFKTIVDTLSSQMSHISMTITNDHLILSGVDMAHVSIVNITLLSSSFSTFRKATDQDVNMHVSIDHFKRILRGCKTDDSITITLKQEHDTAVFVQFENEFRTVSFKLPMLDIDQDSIDVPELEYETTVHLPALKFHTVFQDLNVLSPETVCIQSTNEYVQFASDEHGCETEMSVCVSDDVRIDWTDNVSVQVSVDKFLAYSTMAKMCDDVHLHLSCDYPVYIHFPLVRTITTNDGKKEKLNVGDCKCHIAPRTTD